MNEWMNEWMNLLYHEKKHNLIKIIATYLSRLYTVYSVYYDLLCIATTV